MPWSDDSRRRAMAVLHTAPNGPWQEFFAALQTSMELHQFALNYNVNDGFAPLWATVRSPLCDAGTALYLYWQFAEAFLDEEDEDCQPDWDERGLLAEIESRYLGLTYPCQIAFDPLDYFSNPSISQEFLGRLREGRLACPPQMCRATPGLAVEKDWLEGECDGPCCRN